MAGELNDILPEPVSEANAEVIQELLRRKVMGAARVSVRLLRAMEERFGPEAREVMDDMIAKLKPNPRPDAGDPREDLATFAERLERGCAGSHRWEVVAKEPDRAAYHFTYCIWADVYRALGEPELGFLHCAGDEPNVKSWNPKLGFRRSKVLMRGDDVCDHQFIVEE